MFERPGPDLSSVVKGDIKNIQSKCRREIEALASSTVLITGCTGFLARELTESLLASREEFGIRLVLTSRDPAKVRGTFGDRVENDVEIVPIEKMKGYGGKLDYIVHAASPCNPRLYNAHPYQTMLDISRMTQDAISLGMRNELRNFLLMSSVVVYGEQPPLMERVPEEHLGAPDIRSTSSCYGEAKRFSELLLRSSGLPCTILRGFSSLGPNVDLDSSLAVPDFITRAFREGKIVINSDGRPIRSYCYESDYAIMMLRTLVGASGRTLNAGNDRPQVSIRQLAEMIAERIGGVEVEVKGRPGPPGPPPRSVPDISKMREFHEPEVDLEQGLDRTLRHLREKVL